MPTKKVFPREKTVEQSETDDVYLRTIKQAATKFSFAAALLHDFSCYAVGSSVGATVGSGVGATVGTGVGACVGTGVGA